MTDTHDFEFVRSLVQHSTSHANNKHDHETFHRPIQSASMTVRATRSVAARVVFPTLEDEGWEICVLDEGDADGSSRPISDRDVPPQSQMPRRSPPSPSSKDLQKLQRLAEACPDATEAEVRRFLADRGTVSSSSKKLAAYLRWRDANERAKRDVVRSDASSGSSRGASDLETWDLCCRAAGRLLSVTPSKGGSLRLPRVARMVGTRGDGVVDLGGRAVLIVTPAMLDDDLAPISAYARATAMYCDAVLDRTDAVRVTLVVDVRPGGGWANPSPRRVGPYLRELSRTGGEMFPGRLERAVAVPVPAVCVGLWNALRPLLDKKHAARVSLVGGPATLDAVLPLRGMCEYFPPATLEAMEQCRNESILVHP